MLVDERLDMTHPCALTAQRAKCVLCCTKSSVGSRVREGILPLCSALVTETPPGTQHSALGYQLRKNMDLLE